MKRNRKCGMLGDLALALAGALVFAGLASAQDVSGKFTLPFEARWGLATFPAGQYEFSIPRLDSNAMVTVYRGTRAVALILSQGRSAVSAGSSALTVVRTRNGNVVRDLSLPQMGVGLQYAPYKPKRGLAAAEREIAQEIAIPIEGK